jgi:hypothetical protein
VGGVVTLVGIGACSVDGRSARADEPVTEVEATDALDGMVALAAHQTPTAMAQLCETSLDDCAGMSGSVLTEPRGELTAPPAGSPPSVLCSRDAGDGAWMLVIEGTDGPGRGYVSQVVFVRNPHDGQVVPAREPAFWLGIAYAGPKVTGSTSWATAYTAGDYPANEFTDKMLGRARATCDQG